MTTVQPEIRRGHPYFMHDAILRQPQALAEVLFHNRDQAQGAAEALVKKRRLCIVGIGTSWHAALIAQHWFRHFLGGASGPEVTAWNSFEFCAYPPRLDSDTAVIVISHRGTKTASFEALELAKRHGCHTVAITSNNPGPRIQIADVMLTTVEQERSAAFTVSYTAALGVLGQLALGAAYWRDPGEEFRSLRAELERIPVALSRIVARQDEIHQTARKHHRKQRFISVGWGPNTANAYEVALKLKETSAVDSEGFQIEQLLHGPFCAANSHSLVTIIAPPGPGQRRALNLAQASAAAEAGVWALVPEGERELSHSAADSFALPEVSEFWSPLVYIVPLQLFTYYTALARGTHPDLFQQDNPKQAAARKFYDL